MSQMKALADQLRNISQNALPEGKIATSDSPKAQPENIPIEVVKCEKKISKREKLAVEIKPGHGSRILEEIKEFPYAPKNSDPQIHPRIDNSTMKVLNGFKIATGTDLNRIIAFSIHKLFANHPELKTIIKQSLENLQL